MTFRPFPGLTVFTVISLAILIALGTWQVKRLGWKHDIIANVEAAANASALTRIDSINKALVAGEPLEYRRVSLSGAFETTAYHLNAPRVEISTGAGKAGFGWHPVRPFQTDMVHVLVRDKPFLNAQKSNPPMPVDSDIVVNGYIRLMTNRAEPASNSNPADNRWFGMKPIMSTFNSPENDEQAQIRATDFFIDLHSITNTPEAIPVRVPDISNRHLEYLITWYSFAIILLIIYIILHMREGRLRFGRN